MGSLSSVEDLGVSMFSYGFTLYPRVCLLQWRTVTGVRLWGMQVLSWMN